MNGHTKRAHKKQKDIKLAALELFNKYGAARVSLEEVARQAGVSKVTIYKYFESKDGLYLELIKMIFDENIENLQSILDSDRPFEEKMKYLISTKSNARLTIQGDFLKNLVRSERHLEEYIETNYAAQIKRLVYAFVDQGKNEGFIDSSLDNQTVYLYIEIFKAGLKEKAEDLQGVWDEKDTFDRLIELFFHGLVRMPES